MTCNCEWAGRPAGAYHDKACPDYIPSKEQSLPKRIRKAIAAVKRSELTSRPGGSYLVFPLELAEEAAKALDGDTPETCDVARDAARYRFIRQSESVLAPEHEKEFAEMWADIYQKNTSEFMDRRIDRAMNDLKAAPIETSSSLDQFFLPCDVKVGNTTIKAGLPVSTVLKSIKVHAEGLIAFSGPASKASEQPKVAYNSNGDAYLVEPTPKKANESDPLACNPCTQWDEDGLCVRCGAAFPEKAHPRELSPPTRSDIQSRPLYTCPVPNCPGNHLSKLSVCAVENGDAP